MNIEILLPIREVVWAWSPGDRMTANFKASELVDDGHGYPYPVDVQLLRLLQKIRIRAAAAVDPTSGYRRPTRNAEVGGAKMSLHMTGMAADIRVAGMSPVQVAGLALALGATGIGIAQTFTHVDVRIKPAGEWDGWEYLKDRRGTKPISETTREKVIQESRKWPASS